jgi:monooxygenase
MATLEHFDVLIVGAGISGIGMGCHLRREHPEKSFAILEGREAIGGTWDLFRYPGIRSDSDMYTFGYSFRPWKEDQDIASGDAILRYLNETVAEYDLGKEIRFRHRVQALEWSSVHRRWTLTVRQPDGSERPMSCDFLVTCTGYYDYEKGHLPDFAGVDDFEGQVVHPQHWPSDLDYDGKKVVVIGSGATAVTLVPTMAKDTAHVTMLQRSPTYIVSRPAEDAIAKKLRGVLPAQVAHQAVRVKNVMMGRLIYRLSKRSPDRVRAYIRKQAIEMLGPDIDVDTHFRPTYDPWDQRLCLIPDGDLYEALQEGSASIVTDTIERFTAKGVQLSSGEVLEADIVVPATGLKLQFLGGAAMKVDGEALDPSDLVSYRGVMFGEVPNWVAVIGYTSASWTLKADLTSAYLMRLLSHMDSRGYDTVTPRLPSSGVEKRPIMSNLLSAGYVKRGAKALPQQGSADPWVNGDDYARDYLKLRWQPIDDGVLTFTDRKDHRPMKLPRLKQLLQTVQGPRRLELRGKTAVVTGAASGIGEAVAEELARRGCELALVDVDERGLERVAAQVRKHVDVTTYVCDMGDMSAVERLGSELLTEHPAIDVLINNAGVAIGGDVAHLSRQDIEWLMNINFYGVVTLTRALLPHLLQRPQAQIANVSSVFGIIAPPGQATYCASKFAVRGFSEALRRELAGTSVGVSVIHPGGIKTAIAKSARVAANADPEPFATKGDEFEKTAMTTPAKAAGIILRGLERRKPRILVGPDAHLIAAIARLAPVKNAEILMRLVGWKHEPSRPKPSEAGETATRRHGATIH